EHVEPFARRQLAEEEDEGRAPGDIDADPPPERAGLHTNRELLEIDRVWNELDGLIAYAEHTQLRAFGAGDRKYPRGAGQHPVTGEHVEGELGHASPRDPRGRPMGCQHVRHTGRPKMTSRNHTGKIPTGVQVCDVEGSRVIRHISVEAEWDEKLQVIRQPVRQIWKDPDGE